MLTYERLHQLLFYDEEDGCLYWKPRGIPKWDTRWAGSQAGTIKRDKKFKGEYLTLGIDGIKYRVHRIIWWMKTGENPVSNIDHKDHNGLNNLWDNLRLADHSVNQKNLSKRKDNTTGFTGVVLSRNRQKFVAQIQVDNKMIRLGTRDTPEEAYELRKQAEVKYGFHQNHGK